MGSSSEQVLHPLAPSVRHVSAGGQAMGTGAGRLLLRKGLLAFAQANSSSRHARHVYTYNGSNSACFTKPQQRRRRPRPTAGRGPLTRGQRRLHALFHRVSVAAVPGQAPGARLDPGHERGHVCRGGSGAQASESWVK